MCKQLKYILTRYLGLFAGQAHQSLKTEHGHPTVFFLNFDALALGLFDST